MVLESVRGADDACETVDGSQPFIVGHSKRLETVTKRLAAASGSGVRSRGPLRPEADPTPFPAHLRATSPSAWEFH